MKKNKGMVWIKTLCFLLIITSCFLELSCQCNNKIINLPSITPPEITQPAKPVTITQPQISGNLNQPPSYNIDQKLIPMDQRIPAKDFQLPTLDGKTFQLSSLEGTIVLLDFSTTWCIFCTKQEPHLDKLYEDYHDKSFQIISIFCKENKQTVLSKYPSGKHIYPVLLDDAGTVSSNEYSVRGYPYYLLLDKHGNIAYTQSGFNENMYDIIAQLIEKLNSEF